MKKRSLGRCARGDETPIAVETGQEKKPVEPGHMVGNEQDRPGRAQDGVIVGAKPEREAEKEAKDGYHGRR